MAKKREQFEAECLASELVEGDRFRVAQTRLIAGSPESSVILVEVKEIEPRAMGRLEVLLTTDLVLYLREDETITKITSYQQDALF